MTHTTPTTETSPADALTDALRVYTWLCEGCTPTYVGATAAAWDRCADNIESALARVGLTGDQRTMVLDRVRDARLNAQGLRARGRS